MLNEKNFLENIAITDETTKFLLKNQNWLANTEKILFGEVISIDNKYKKAVNSILREHLSYFLINNPKDAENAINILKNSKQGKTGFILLEDAITNQDEKLEPAGEGVIGWLSDFIQTKDEYKHLINRFFSGTLLIENIENANTILSQNNIEQVVAIDGTIITKNKVIFGGGEIEDKNALLLGRRNRIQELNIKINTMSDEINHIQNDLKEQQMYLSELKISDFERATSNLNKKIIDLEKERIQLENKIQNEQNSYSQIDENITNYKREIDELTQEIEKEEENIELLSQEIEEVSGNLTDEQSKYADLRSEFDELSATLKQKEIALARLQTFRKRAAINRKIYKKY